MRTKRGQSTSRRSKTESAKRGWIGVVASLETRDRLMRDDETWWCLPAEAQQGEIVALYRTRKKFGETQQGIFALFEFGGFDKTQDAKCIDYGHGTLFYGRIRMIKRFARAIPPKELRGDPVFQHSYWMRRSLQGTIFRMSADEVTRLLQVTADIPHFARSGGVKSQTKSHTAA